MTTSSGHVPVHINPFVGRGGELTQLEQFYKLGTRLVTITGPGGAGKTRLASEFARRHAEADGRVVFVDLTRNETVVSAMSAIMGVAEDSSAVLKALGTRASANLLVVLDNLEHVVDDAALFVPKLLGLPSVRILGTSREPLRLGGEQVVRLGALSPEEAFELFELRARSVIPEFSVGDQSRDAIEEIVDRVDRLPLAIELAASRVNVLSPQGLAERLTRRMSALKSKDRDRPERHRTVAATAQWSWELLTAEERAVLRQLTAFQGAFELKDAERVVELPGVGVLDVIEDLVDRSMIERGGNRGLRLFQAIYGLAAAELEQEGEHKAVFERHAAHFANVVFRTDRHLRGGLKDLLPELRLAMTRVSGEPMLAALAATASILCEVGGVQSRLQDFEAAIAADIQNPVVKAELLLGAAVAQLDLLDLVQAAERAYAAGEVARKARNSELEVQACVIESLATSWRGDNAAALKLLEHALTVAQSESLLHAELNVRGNLALVLSQLGEEDRARDVIETALMRARSSGDDLALARLLVNVGLWHVDNYRWSEATPLLEEAIDLLGQLGDHRFEAHAQAALARCMLYQGRTDEARGLYVRADHTARDWGQTAVRLEALIGLGSLRESPSDRVYLVKAVDLAMNTDSHTEEVLSRSMLMLFDMRFGSFPLARHQARRLCDDPRLPDEWRTAVKALSALTAGWSGDAADVPEAPPADTWVARLIRLVHAIVRASSASGDASAVVDVRRRLAELAEASVSDELASWPTSHVQHVLEEIVGERFAQVDVQTLRLHPEGRFFQPPDGEVVDFSRRGALRRVLVGLGHARLGEPGKAIPLDDVLEMGWPGEIVTADAGAARVYSAIRTLRNNGLEGVIQTSDEGYFLSPDVAVVFDDELRR